MKIDWVADFRTNELEVFSFVSMLIGIIMLGGGIFWDVIAGVQINHNKGMGWQQMSWCGFWGCYVFFAWYILSKWGE